ncbi:MAG: hypothetical protein JHC80_05415, partial [Polynucleobacter sp.]|nr:hypothetical protein [Polynucleobacter sp.]
MNHLITAFIRSTTLSAILAVTCSAGISFAQSPKPATTPATPAPTAPAPAAAPKVESVNIMDVGRQ